MPRYRIEFNQEIEINSAVLIAEFGGEWDDAQKRGLDEDGFARECFGICDWETLMDFATNHRDRWEVDAL